MAFSIRNHGIYDLQMPWLRGQRRCERAVLLLDKLAHLVQIAEFCVMVAAKHEEQHPCLAVENQETKRNEWSSEQR